MQPNEYAQFAGPLLAVLGGALQFLRALRKFPEWAYYLMGAFLALTAYGLTHVPGNDWRLETIQAVLGTASNLATLMGGTFGMATLANSAAESAKAHPLVPATNSKGGNQ